MLYVTTRSKKDAYTAARTMTLDRGPDGGLFIPYRVPMFTQEQILEMSQQSFGKCVADILNVFFGTKISGWDVDMILGRTPFKLKSMNYRITVVELWHNMDHHYSRAIYSLARRLHPDGDIIGGAGDWPQIAIRVALLFGIFRELLRNEQVNFEKPMDVAVPTGNFCAPMAVWYARKMGLPIGTIICGCNENSAPWELLHRGELDTGVVSVSTNTPEDDLAVPFGLERLICETCGQEETLNFVFSCTEGGTYIPSERAFASMRRGLFAAVVSRDRENTIIPSVYHTNQYILDPYSALAYGALSDYRARNGSSRSVLLLCERSPICSSETVAKAMQIPVSELSKRISEM
ncbi:MAG: hypothetical protein IJW14_05295 [Oscillospiraceae bacterium]|nr:hypothetical protein [Oscillospiraceae bacterium]